VIYVPSFIKIGSSIQKLIGEDTQTERWSHKPTLILFQNKVALTSPTNGGRSIVIVRLRSKATELLLRKVG
jgi:hypothetical protein